MSETIVYSAKKIITMNPSRPEATHVAVRDGRILGAGSLSELQTWGDVRLDERFKDKVLMPGFVEGHAHVMEGSLWSKVYCGWFDRADPDGKLWSGVKSVDAVVERLRAAEAALEDPAAAVSGWQLDPIYMDNITVTRADLDRVSTTRPVGVLHASGHIMNVNTKALELAGMMKTGHNHPGIPLGADGLPTGELKGPEVMTPVGPFVGFERNLLDADEAGLRNFAKLCVRTGTTTITDLASRMDEDTVDMMLRVTSEPHYPIRLMPFRFFLGLSAPELVETVLAMKKRATDRLRLGQIKIVVGWFDPRVFRSVALARLSQRCAERALVYRTGASVRAIAFGLGGWGAGAYPHQRRSGHAIGFGKIGDGFASASQSGSPFHVAALPIGRCCAVPFGGKTWDVC